MLSRATFLRRDGNAPALPPILWTIRRRGELAYRGAQYLLAASDDPDIGNIALQEALAAYEFALQNHPDRPEAQEARGQLGALYVQTKQPDKAAAILTAAIQEVLSKDPSSPLAARLYLTLGYAYFQKGDMARADRRGGTRASVQS